MKLKFYILSFFIGIISSQTLAQQITTIPLKYDVSGYADSNTKATNQRISATITDNTLVPTVNAEMNASESGALNYMLPIEILKGVNNFQPNFAIAYNSQSGNGQAGWGWNIVGLSTIAQGGKSKDIDGITIGAQYDSSDPFYLDGQRLIKNSATEFVTEKFSKIKITKQTTGEFSFIVQYTDGKIAKYKEIVPGQHYISTFIDSFNNQIHYTYSVLGNTPRLTHCSYGGTDVNSDKFYINFNYKDRKNSIKVYRNGVEFINSKVIDFIESGSTYTGKHRKYNFLYDYIEGNTVERLKTVTVENESGESLKPLNFSYNVSTQGGIIPFIRSSNAGLLSSTVALGSVGIGDFLSQGEVKPVYQVKDNAGKFSLISSQGYISNNISTLGNTTFYSGKALYQNKMAVNDQLITVTTDYKGYISGDNDSSNSTNYNLVDEVTFHIQNLKTGQSRNTTVNLKGSTVYVREYLDQRDEYDYNSQVAVDNLYRDEASREFVSGDFNNDGLVDFLIFEPQGLNRPNKIYFAEIGKNEAINITPVVLNEGLSLNGLDYYVVEFNGDGIPEIMAVNKYNANYWIYKIDMKNNSFSSIATGTLSNFSSKTPIFFGDFNGDGLTDFITPQRVYDLNQNDNYAIENALDGIERNNEALLWWKYSSNGLTFVKQQEDYTSQKLAYIIPSQSNVIKRSSFWEKFWNGKPDSYEYTKYITTNISVTDFNGDGRSDIINFVKTGKIKYPSDGKIASSQLQGYSPYYSVIDGYSDPYDENSAITHPENYNFPNKIYFLENTAIKDSTPEHKNAFTQRAVIPINDYNISPLSLIISSTDSNQLNTYKSGIYVHDPLTRIDYTYTVNNDNFLEKQITSVDNGSSVIQSIEYKPMIPSTDKTEACYIFNDATQYQYPYYIHNTNGSYYLVNKIHTLFDGKVLTKEYRYENGIQQLDGKGFLGFRKTYASDAYESELYNGKYRAKNPIKAIFWNIQTRNPLMENAVEVSTYGGIKDFFTINTVTSQRFDKGNHQYLILSTHEISRDNLKKITISKKYDYDLNDDLKLKTAYTDYNGIGTSTSKYTYQPEFSNGDHYFYGKIATSEDTTYKDGLSFSTKQESIYDTTNGAVSEVKKYGNDANAPSIVNKYTYYPEGNLKTETLSTTGITDQTTSYEYDVTKRYVNKTTTPDGLFSTSVVNALGRVSSEVSSLGLTTSYTYDSWGNITEITDYLGKKTTISKSSVTSPTGAVYSLSKKREGGTETVVVFDKFDREILSKTQSINNKWLVTKTEYDIFGRKIRTSEPSFEGETEKWNSVEYDELGRPVKSTAFTGKIVKTCYEGMKVTVDDGYKKTSKTLDAMGNTIRHQDHGGVINYLYYPNGALRETNYEGIRTTFLIDGWGNKKRIVDPSAGTFDYEYDNLSRITKEIINQSIN